MTDGGNAIDRGFEALARGDCQAALACYTPDAKVWHSFDGIAHDLPAMAVQWQALIDGSTRREVGDVRRHAIANGFVQQHVMAITDLAGTTRMWSICMVVTIRDGLISRLDEYIDRAGFFTLQPGEPLINPGF